jgi:hypothetical protein
MASRFPILLSVKFTMTTTEHIQNTNNQTVTPVITEVWNVIKGDQILVSGPTEKAAWRAIGAKNQYHRNELISFGFKVVKA